MKIALISRGMPSQQYPLYGIFEFDQAKALAKAGHEVSFVAIDFREAKFKRRHGLFAYDKDGVHIFELSLPIGAYRRGIPLLQRLLLIPFRAMIKKHGLPDLIHAHFYFIGNIASIIKKRYHTPLIITEHSSKLNKNIQEISDLDKKIATSAYRSCDELICVSEALQERILSNFKCQSKVAFNIVDTNLFHCQNQAKRLPPFIYVSVGNLTPNKSFDKLIEAFSMAQDNARLIIIGDGPEREKLKQHIAVLGLEAKVSLKGQLDRQKINDIYQESHVFALASESETFGVSFVEALYAGLPVIATRCGGPESFVNSSNGLLVPVNDTKALAEAMIKIRENYSSYDLKGISSECKRRFSPESIASTLVEIYQSLFL